MTCEHVKIGDAHAIICSRGGRKPPKCRWCNKPSTKLCDYQLARGHTCDAPMCDDHAKNVGQNLDHCPDHPYQRLFR